MNARILSGIFLLSLTLSTPVAVAQVSQQPKVEKALARAIYEKDADELRDLLKKGASARTRLREFGERTLVHFAVEHEFVSGIEILLQAGALANAKVETGWTPLHLASAGASVRVVEALVEHGARVDRIDALGATPLHYAAQFGEHALVVYLLEHGGVELANLRDARGWTALMRAEALGQKRCCEIIRRHARRVGGELKSSTLSSPLFRLRVPREEPNAAKRSALKELKPILEAHKRSMETVFEMSSWPNNGPGSERNTHHQVCAVWSDGLYLVRAGYFSPDYDPRLPPLVVGFLEERELAEFLFAITETEYFSPKLPGGTTFPCGGALSASLILDGRRLKMHDASSWRSGGPGNLGLRGRIYRDALKLLTRLITSVVDVDTQALNEYAKSKLIRGYKSGRSSLESR